MPKPDEILVVTATLGRSRWLQETVDSVAPVRSAGVPIRHRIACPTPEVDRLRSAFPECEVVESKEVGVYPAINLGARMEEGWEAWTWLNDDDRWRSEGIRKALEVLGSDPTVDIVYGRVDYIDVSGVRLGALPVESEPQRFRMLMAGGISPLSQHGTFVRRAFATKLGPLDESLRLGADFDYWARAVAAGARFRFVDAVVAEFRLRPGQLSGDTAAIRREINTSAHRLFASLPRWRVRAAALAFRFRHVGEIIERFRLTGRWRTRDLYSDASTKGETR